MKIEPKLSVDLNTIILLVVIVAAVIWYYQVKEKGLAPAIGEAAGKEMAAWFGKKGAPTWTTGVPPLMLAWDYFNG